MELTQLLQHTMYKDIPVTQHLGICVEHYHSQKLILSAPLSSNINHNETAFGGSIATLGTLACWGLIFVELTQRDLTGRIVIQRGHTEYLQPISDDFIAECMIGESGELERFIYMFMRKKTARIYLSANILCHGKVGATFSGAFVVRAA